MKLGDYASCQYAKWCPRRMRDGDRADGCSTRDQKTCTPSLDKPKVE